MVKINVYGPDGQIMESNDISSQPAYNDPACPHKRVIDVDDDSIEGARAIQCQDCSVGWLLKEKLKES